MDARERLAIIAEAAAVADIVGFGGTEPFQYDRLERDLKSKYERVALAAVSAAYEIDGVGELIEAAEVAKRMMGNYGWCRESAEAVNVSGAAAARVREAMGGET